MLSPSIVTRTTQDHVQDVTSVHYTGEQHEKGRQFRTKSTADQPVSEEDLKHIGKSELKRLVYPRREDIRYRLNDKTLQEAVDFLNSKIVELKDEAPKLHIEYDYDDCIEVEIRYTHTETDKEYTNRLRMRIEQNRAALERTEKMKDTNKKKEKAVMRRLMKKYKVKEQK